MGTVLHFQRPTKVNRISLSAVNIYCSKTDNQFNRDVAWKIIQDDPSRPINYDQLNMAVKMYHMQIAKRKALHAASKIDW